MSRHAVPSRACLVREGSIPPFRQESSRHRGRGEGVKFVRRHISRQMQEDKVKMRRVQGKGGIRRGTPS